MRPVLKHVAYDTAKYPFREAVAEYMRIDDLSRYHEIFLQAKRARGGRAVITYADNLACRELLKGINEEPQFAALSASFLREVIAPRFHGKCRASEPYFRVQMGRSTSVSAWHRDVDVTHNPDLVTAWVPFVDTAGPNAIWVETEYGNRDYVPIPVRYGEILFFDSALLWHGSVTNDGEVTRFSMDIRIRPLHTKAREPDFGIFAARPPELQLT